MGTGLNGEISSQSSELLSAEAPRFQRVCSQLWVLHGPQGAAWWGDLLATCRGVLIPDTLGGEGAVTWKIQTRDPKFWTFLFGCDVLATGLFS